MTKPVLLKDEVQTARTAINRKGFAGARDDIDALIAVYPDSDDLYALKALITLWTEGFEAADAMVTSRQVQHESAALFGIGAEIALFVGDVNRHEEQLLQGIALDADHFLVLRTQISALTMDGKRDEAVVLADHCLQLYPEDLDTFSQMITILSTDHDRTAAWRALDNAPAWFLNSAQYHSASGRLAMADHNLDKAEQEFRLAVATCPTGASYWSWLGMAQRYRDRYDAAEESCRNALSLNRNDSKALKTMAAIEERRGNSAASREYLERADKAIPGLRASSQFRKAMAMLSQNNVKGATAVYRQIASGSMPTIARTARQLLIMALIQRKHWSEAEQELESALLIDGETDGLLIHRMQLRQNAADLPGALQDLDRLINRPSPCPGAIPPGLKLLLETGDYARADGLVAYLMDRLPGVPAQLGASIMILDSFGRKEQARALHSAAIRKYPDNSILKVVSVGFAAEDGRPRNIPYLVNQLPPALRKTIMGRAARRIPFWKALWRRMRRGIRK